MGKKGFPRKDGTSGRTAPSIGRKFKQRCEAQRQRVALQELESQLPNNHAEHDVGDNMAIPSESLPRKRQRRVFQPCSAPKISPDEIEPSDAPNLSAEQFFDLLDEEDRRRKGPLFEDVALRLAIAQIFERVHGGEPDSEEKPWHGKGGIVVQIRKALNLNPTQYIDYVLFDVLECKSKGLTYTGEGAPRKGRPPILSTDSEVAQIVADVLEHGGTFKMATQILNFHLMEKSQEPGAERFDSVTYSCVRGLALRMKPTFVPVGKRKQGSNDPESDWARARYNFVTQLLIRYGLLEDKDIPRDHNGEIPKWYRKEELTPLHKDGVAHWDETHPQCKAGFEAEGAYVAYIPRFKRDKTGKVCDDGEADLKEVNNLVVKYGTQVRMGIGAACVTPVIVDPVTGERTLGPMEGRRCKPFFYTEKKMVTHKDYEELIMTEVRRARTMARDPNNPNHAWLSFEDEAWYENDSIVKLTGLATTWKDRLNALGVVSLGDMIDLTDEQIAEIHVKDSRIKIDKVTAWRQEAIDGKTKRSPRPPRVSEYFKFDFQTINILKYYANISSFSCEG